VIPIATDTSPLIARHREAIRALAAAEARYRRAEAEDYEARIDARHGGQLDPGTPATDRAAQALADCIAAEEAARYALEDARPTSLTKPTVREQLAKRGLAEEYVAMERAAPADGEAA
jgi:hypothetical protein